VFKYIVEVNPEVIGRAGYLHYRLTMRAQYNGQEATAVKYIYPIDVQTRGVLDIVIDDLRDELKRVLREMPSHE